MSSQCWRSMLYIPDLVWVVNDSSSDINIGAVSASGTSIKTDFLNRWSTYQLEWDLQEYQYRCSQYYECEYQNRKLPHLQNDYNCETQFPCLSRREGMFQPQNSQHHPARSDQSLTQTCRWVIFWWPFISHCAPLRTDICITRPFIIILSHHN